MASKRPYSGSTDDEPFTSAEADGGLSMSSAQMLDLARKAAEFVVERIENLPGEDAWDGDFRHVLEGQLMEDPPEAGLPAEAVMERAAREILPLAARLDHPRCFGFIPSSPTWPGVLADFMAAGYHVNQCTWLVASGPSQLELVVIDWFRRWLGYPEARAGSSRAAARRPASMHLSLRVRRRATPNVPPST